MSFSYDSGGNMLSALNTQGGDTFSYSFAYDAAGDVTSVSEPFGASISFGYNKAGQRTSVSDSFGGSEALGYDGAGDLTTLTFNSDSLSINFTYNQADQLTLEKMYCSGTLIATVSETYDGAGNVLSIVETASSSATFASFSYAYDKANELLSETDYLAGSATTSTSYSYDAQGELISAGTSNYSYNLAGDPNGTSDSSTYGNELTNFSDPFTSDKLSYTYDSAGNEVSKIDITTGDTWTYSYNNANQITTAVELNSSAVTLGMVSDEYDAFGNMVKETVTSYSAGTATSSLVTEYAVDGWNPAKAGAIGNSAFDDWAVLGKNSGGTFGLQTRNVQGNGIDQILARVDNTTYGASGTGLYLDLTDRLGSVRDVLNSAGTSVSQASYDAWGNQIGSPSIYQGMYGWDGYDYDAATNLYRDNARFYDPQSQALDVAGPTRLRRRR